jgi:hypothetical protein
VACTIANAAVGGVIAFTGACVPTLDLALRSFYRAALPIALDGIVYQQLITSIPHIFSYSSIPPKEKATLPSYQVKHFYVWLLKVHIKNKKNMISNSVIRLVTEYIFIVYICIFGSINTDNLFHSIYILY